MNATEAKTKSLSNAPKLVNSHLKRTVSEINNVIKSIVDCGDFKMRYLLELPNNVEKDVIKLLIIHYRELGYEVDIRIFGHHSKFIFISWE